MSAIAFFYLMIEEKIEGIRCNNKLLVCLIRNKELIIVPSCSHSENNVYHALLSKEITP